MLYALPLAGRADPGVYSCTIPLQAPSTTTAPVSAGTHRSDSEDHCNSVSSVGLMEAFLGHASSPAESPFLRTNQPNSSLSVHFPCSLTPHDRQKLHRRS